MNLYFLAAAVASFLLGFAHSIIGEVLIFRTDIWVRESAALGARRSAALRSTWHLLTLFGWALAGLFVWMATSNASVAVLGVPIAVFFCVCSIFWLIGTRGRHPAWVVFAAIAGLSYLGSI